MNKVKDNAYLSIYKFFGLTIFISWTLWSPLYISEGINEFWVLPGAWGPTIAAILLTYINTGKVGLKKLFRKLLIWKVNVKYYLFAIFSLFVIALISVTVYGVLGGKLPGITVVLEGMGIDNGDLSLALLLLPVFYLVNTLLGGPIAEELGWRGYAQELLQNKYGPNVSGLIIGFMWGIWHLPLFIFLPKAVGSMPIWFYIPLMTSMGLVFSWLYNKTNGSVLLAILLHGGMNFAHGFLGADVFKDLKLLSIQVLGVIVLTIILSRRNKEPVANNIQV